MKLKKRIYLLTPLLVLVCVIAAGVFMKAPAKVEAEGEIIFEKGNYKPLTMAEVIEKSETEKYEIAEFDVNLFDYNGDAWNAFSAWRFIDTGFFAFKQADIVQDTEYKYVGEGSNAAGYYELMNPPGAVANIFNYGPNQNIRGIMESELVNGYPAFTQKVGNDGLRYYREQILFNPSKIEDFVDYNGFNNQLGLWSGYTYLDHINRNKEINGKAQTGSPFSLEQIRSVYGGKFQFVYDNDTEYYTYDSSKNHAQFVASETDSKGNPIDANNDGKIDGNVVLYADTLATTNAAADQSVLITQYDTFATQTEDVKKRKAVGNNDRLPFTNMTNFGDDASAQTQKTTLNMYAYNNTFGRWTIAFDTNVNYIDNTSGVKGLRLWQKTDSNTTSTTNKQPQFSPGIRFQNFIHRTTQGDIDQSHFAFNNFTSEQVEYIYIKFKMNTDITKHDGFVPKLAILFDGDDKGVADSDYNPDADLSTDKNMLGRYVYDYSNQIGKDIELYIPVKDCVGSGKTIESLMLIPFYCPAGKNTQFHSDGYDATKAVEIYLYNFSLVFSDDTNRNNETLNTTTSVYDSTNKGIDSSAVSNFLPFHKIENSYMGAGRDHSYYVDTNLKLDGTDTEETKKNNANAILNQWEIKDTLGEDGKRVQIANRSVANICYGDFSSGLGAVGNNDFGGTASHFGMTMSVDFFIPLDKQTNKDQPIVFEFLGDDDMWVFVDGKLALDIGGHHSAISGTINFTDGKVVYKGDTKNINRKLDPSATNNKFVGTVVSENDLAVDAAGLYSFELALDEALSQPGKHTLQIFYLERASGASNCYISFNLPQIPDGALTVSNQIGKADDSELEIPNDLNNDGYDDLYLDNDTSNDLFIYNNNGEIGYKNFVGDIVSEKMITSIYEAEYIVPKAYVEDGLYSLEYSLYRTNSPEDTVVSGLNFASVIVDSTSNFYKYIVRFEVPVGYTASMFMPEDGVITRVIEVNPFDTSGLDSRFGYSGTKVNTENSELTPEDRYNLLDDDLTVYGNVKLDEDTAMKLEYTNLYRAELYDLTIEKKFKAGDPVPVGQSILFKVEGGNIDPNDPLYVNMLIKDPGNGANPNVVTVTDLPKGNYTVTEISDWSWRYVCYNVLVQRDNNTVASGNGTIIGVNPIPESKG